MLHKMKSLGADIVYIDVKNVNIPVHLLSALLADDNDITYFIIRDARQRLSNCDADAVKEFIASDKTIHCVKDTHTHNNTYILPGVWGGNRRKLMNRLGGIQMKKFIQVSNKYMPKYNSQRL